MDYYREQYKKRDKQEIQNAIKEIIRSDNGVSNIYDYDDVNDISDFLEYGVEDVEWLRVCNSQIPYTELIDKNAIRDYLVEKNSQYCEKNGLCEICRNPLKRYDLSEEVWGSKQVVGYEYSCEFGCS